MKNIKSALILIFAVIGVCAVVYGSWHLYQRHVANEQAKAAFSAPPAKGVPDMYHNAPPPPQP
jgi:cytochrome c-type biogenesis protein CcmH/NrfG